MCWGPMASVKDLIQQKQTLYEKKTLLKTKRKITINIQYSYSVRLSVSSTFFLHTVAGCKSNIFHCSLTNSRIL